MEPSSLFSVCIDHLFLFCHDILLSFLGQVAGFGSGGEGPEHARVNRPREQNISHRSPGPPLLVETKSSKLKALSKQNLCS